MLRFDQPITDVQLQDVQVAIAVARAGKDSGADGADAEHLLQERLRGDWKLLGLRAAPLREVPVRRPVGYGYIDLVGAGKDGRIRVIETKLGPFDRLVFQGLDYWIWATANAKDIAEWLDLPADAGVDIDYVVAEKTPGHGVIGSYTSGQAEAIQGRIRWRFTTIRDWRDTHADGRATAFAHLAIRIEGEARSSEGRAPLVGPAGASSRRPRPRPTASRSEVACSGPTPPTGSSPRPCSVHERLVADGLAHHMVGHVRSSQAFALNLFAPLDETGRVRSLLPRGSTRPR